MTPDGPDATPTSADVDMFLDAVVDPDFNIDRNDVHRGLAAAAPAIGRRAVAAALARLAACYPAEVFTPDGDSRDAVSGTALRTVLTAQAALYQDGG